MCHCLYSKSRSVFQLLLALGFTAFLMPRCMRLGGGGSQLQLVPVPGAWAGLGATAVQPYASESVLMTAPLLSLPPPPTHSTALQ